MKKFWMLIRLHGNSTSMKKHETLEEAKLEATRLCVKERAEIVILEAVEYVRFPRPDLEWKKI